jgi:hypothetical protein
MATSSGRRAALVLGGALLALLVAEGLLSLVGGRTLRGLGGERQIPLRAWRAPTDAERAASVEAADLPGLYRVHEDPLVGLVFRSNAELTIRKVPFTTDALGLRRTPGPPPPDDAFRVVILGDSVAFGFGLEDDEILAARLEHHLGEVLPADGPPVSCRTVAVPGWSHRNAVHFLLDHWDELACDLVVFLPVENDLIDSYSVYESGRRRNAFDIAARDPLLRVSVDMVMATAVAGLHRLQDEGRLQDFEDNELGPVAIISDLSPESGRRYDDNVASMVQLQRFLEARGAQLVSLQTSHSVYHWALLERLHRAGFAGEVVPLFTHPPADWDLGDDPHPNATAVDVSATWIADALLERALVPGAARASALPEVPAHYERTRASLLEPADWVRERARTRARQRLLLKSEISPADGRGLLQAYAGLLPDGSLARRSLLLLPRGDGELRVELAPLPGRADLLPLEVEVRLDGELVGALTLDGRRLNSAVFPVPPGEWPVEVGLSADRDVPIKVEGRTVMAACQLVRLATGDGP